MTLSVPPSANLIQLRPINNSEFNRPCQQKKLSAFFDFFPARVKLQKTSCANRLARRRHKLIQKIQIVVGRRHGTEHLTGLEQVPQVRQAVTPTDPTAAFWVRRIIPVGVLAIADIQPTTPRK